MSGKMSGACFWWAGQYVYLNRFKSGLGLCREEYPTAEHQPSSLPSFSVLGEIILRRTSACSCLTIVRGVLGNVCVTHCQSDFVQKQVGHWGHGGMYVWQNINCVKPRNDVPR